jgi:hypothetical protein
MRYIKFRFLVVAFLAFSVGMIAYQNLRNLTSSIWQKVDTATCAYNSKPCENFVVYRSLTGEIHVLLPEAHPVLGDDESARKFPWTYLIRPDEATEEIAYGKMLSKFGNYAYGYQFTEYKYRSSVRFDKDKGLPPVVIEQNAVEFNSAYRDARIRIAW